MGLLYSSWQLENTTQLFSIYYQYCFFQGKMSVWKFSLNELDPQHNFSKVRTRLGSQSHDLKRMCAVQWAQFEKWECVYEWRTASTGFWSQNYDLGSMLCNTFHVPAAHASDIANATEMICVREKATVPVVSEGVFVMIKVFEPIPHVWPVPHCVLRSAGFPDRAGCQANRTIPIVTSSPLCCTKRCYSRLQEIF